MNRINLMILALAIGLSSCSPSYDKLILSHLEQEFALYDGSKDQFNIEGCKLQFMHPESVHSWLSTPRAAQEYASGKKLIVAQCNVRFSLQDFPGNGDFYQKTFRRDYIWAPTSMVWEFIESREI